MTSMDRLEEVVARLPQTERVDVEAWDGEPTFRVRGKTFIFSAPDASSISVKLSKEEAAAVVATDPSAEPHRLRIGSTRLGLRDHLEHHECQPVARDRGVDSHVLHAGRTEEAGPSGRGAGRATRVTPA
jgi:hypothetical protein